MTDKEPSPNEEQHKTEEQKPGDSNAEEPGKPTGEYFQGDPPERVIMSGKIPAEPINLNDPVSSHVDKMISAEHRSQPYDDWRDNYHDEFVAPKTGGSGSGETRNCIERRDGSLLFLA